MYQNNPERMIVSMKKILAFLCVLMLTVGILALGAVGASAAEAAQTIVDLEKGDSVSYALTLSDVPDRVVGCDFSVYYDSSAFTLNSVADYNDNTDDSEWVATINPDLDGEVRGNWSVLNGVDFSNSRNIVTLNLTAKNNTSAHLSYYVRYMYDNSVFESADKPQISNYTFTCTVKVNGEVVLDKAQPELNVDRAQTSGSFVNSVTGKSADADVNIPAGRSGSSGNKASGGTSAGANGATSATSATTVNEPASKNGSVSAATNADGDIEVTDADGNVIATRDSASSGSGSTVLWIIIAVIIVAAGACIVYYVTKKKGAAAKAEADGTDTDLND